MSRAFRIHPRIQHLESPFPQIQRESRFRNHPFPRARADYEAVALHVGRLN